MIFAYYYLLMQISIQFNDNVKSYQLLELPLHMQNKGDAFERYMFKKQLQRKKEVQLQLSDSDKSSEKVPAKPQQKQLKLSDMFNNRKKTKQQQKNTIEIKSNQDVGVRQLRYQRHIPSQSQIKEMIETQNRNKNLKQEEAPIYEVKAKYERPAFIQERMKALEEQKRLKKLQKKEQERKRNQQQIRKKNEAFKRFLGNIADKAVERNNESKRAEVQLHNLSAFNKMQEQNIEKMIVGQNKMMTNAKSNNGLVFKKLVIERQKIPISFLKLLLQFKFCSKMPQKQFKKVPNSFQDQMTYKKVFHYLVVNECIADLHLRLKKIQETGSQGFPIKVLNFKRNSDGFVQFIISEQLKEQKTIDRDKLPAVKNLSLSKNRLGLITNVKNFKIDHFGIPCNANDRVFAFLCLLVTPQSKEDINQDIKALCNIQIQSLDIIFKINKTNKCYFHDLQKISTHLREYLAITHLYDTQVASFIYNPSLIQKKHLDIIAEQEREQLEPILQRLKTEFNSTQYQSIRQMVLRQSGIVLLQGPPGTGKTTTLMGLLAAEYQYLKNVCPSNEKKKILICAPSNAAIDHITKRIHREGLITVNSNNSISFSEGSIDGNNVSIGSQRVFPKILRVGIVETDDPDIIQVSLDDRCQKQIFKVKQTHIKRNNMTTTQIKQKMYTISKQIYQFRNRKDIQEWERDKKIESLTYQNKKYQNLLFVFRKQKIQLKQTFNQIENKLFQEADIILTTLSSSGAEKMEKIRGLIGCLIIDQAAQSTEPNILIPLQSGARKVLLVGDPYQLPSTTMSQDSSITLFNRSLFQRFLDNGVRPYFLNIQYRMAPLIRQFPSQTFYQNRLVDADYIKNRYQLQPQNTSGQQQNTVNEQTDNLKPISQFFGRNSLFIDVKFGEQQFHSNSYRNVGECIVLKTLILDFIKNTGLSIGVITPYQSQKKYLMKQLKRQIAQMKQLAQQLQNYKKNHQQQEVAECVQNQMNSGVIMQEGQIEVEQQINKQNEQNQRMDQENMENITDKENEENQKIENSEKDDENSDKKEAKEIENTTEKVNNQYTDKGAKLQQLIQKRVMINTVDSFQGQEKDIILVSTVRANDRKDIGFMKDERRINVAITRSKHLLIIIGNADTIGSNQIWNKYLQWSEKNKCLYQIQNRQSVRQILFQMNKDFNNKPVERVKYKKLTKDIRRQERDQIRRQDFGLGLKGSKRVKRQRNYQEPKKLTLLERLQDPVPQNPSNPIENANEAIINKPDCQDVKRNEELMQVKRAKEQQAINLEQVNRRIRQLEQKMKLQQNNPFANLFD